MHDFFKEQPSTRQAPEVVLLRMILHDWADSYARNILQQLRKVAGPETTLVIVDHVVPYACPDPGSLAPPAPKPLIANMGMISAHTYLADLQVR